MVETMILLSTMGGAIRRNRWYIVGGLGLFGLVEMVGRLLGWS